jgi:hypothetical protein
MEEKFIDPTFISKLNDEILKISSIPRDFMVVSDELKTRNQILREKSVFAQYSKILKNSFYGGYTGQTL